MRDKKYRLLQFFLLKNWLTTVAFGECNSSCFSSRSRFGNEAEHWEHAFGPSDRQGLAERPRSSFILLCGDDIDDAADGNDDADDGNRGWWWSWWCAVDNGDVARLILFRRKSCKSSFLIGWTLSMCSFNACNNLIFHIYCDVKVNSGWNKLPENRAHFENIAGNWWKNSNASWSCLWVLTLAMEL